MKHLDKILFVIGAIAFGLSFLDSNDRQGLILGISFMLPLLINWFLSSKSWEGGPCDIGD